MTMKTPKFIKSFFKKARKRIKKTKHRRDGKSVPAYPIANNWPRRLIQAEVEVVKQTWVREEQPKKEIMERREADAAKEVAPESASAVAWWEVLVLVLLMLAMVLEVC
jgi:hypothetical protein